MGVRRASAVAGMSAVWLALMDSVPVGVVAPADAVLRGALAYFVGRGGDLMLMTPSVESGICVEFNHLPSGDEYQRVAWGAFAQRRSG